MGKQSHVTVLFAMKFLIHDPTPNRSQTNNNNKFANTSSNLGYLLSLRLAGCESCRYSNAHRALNQFPINLVSEWLVDSKAIHRYSDVKIYTMTSFKANKFTLHNYQGR